MNPRTLKALKGSTRILNAISGPCMAVAAAIMVGIMLGLV